MCGVRACENMQKRVSHGETVRVGSSVIIIRGNYGGIFCPPLSDIRGKIIFLRGSFALCPRVFPTLPAHLPHLCFPLQFAAMYPKTLALKTSQWGRNIGLDPIALISKKHFIW